MLEQGAQDEEHLRFLRDVGMSSVLIAPLVARERVLGTITLIAAESSKHYSEDDLPMIEDLALMSVGDINNPEIATGGLQFIVLDVLGSTVGTIFLWAVVIAITVCNLAVQSAAIRMMFAMARDNNLPAGKRLAKISPKTKTPVIPAVITGVIAIAILVVNVNQPQIFTVITSIGIIMIYVAYLLVTVPMLLKRLRGQWPPKNTGEGYFSLGKLGLPINILGVLWGAGIAVNLAWPRRDVYNATPPFHWYLEWGAVLFVGVVGGLGFAYYWFVLRHKTGVLADHAPVAEPTSTDPEEATS